MPVPTTANVAHPRAQGYAVAFGDALFRGAFGPGRELQVQTAPLEPPAFDTRSNPEELNEEFGRTFARDDFTGGEGLDFAHTRAERVNKDSRYFDSSNVDISAPDAGDVRSVSLTKAMAVIDATTQSAESRMTYTKNGYLYWIKGVNPSDVLRRSTNPLAAAPVFTDEGVVDPEDVASLGDYVYVADSGSIRRKLEGGAWGFWSSIPAERIWAVKSRIMAADNTGGMLYEAVAGAVPTPLYTLPAGHIWTGCVDSGSAILASADDGNIYAFAPDTTTGALRLVNQSAAAYPVTSLAAAHGFVFYGTAFRRLWRAELADDLTLINVQLLRDFGGGSHNVNAIAATNDGVYIAASETSGQFVWRYDLATTALSRAHYISTDTIYSVLAVGTTVFAGGFTAGLYRTASTYATSGYLIGPLGDFFSAAIKSWVGARLDADDLPAAADGTSVTLYYSTDPESLTDPAHASWTLVASWDTASDITDEELPMTGVESRYIAGKIVLTPNAAATTSPVVRSFGFRAFPGGGGGADNVDQIIQVPINVSDQIERPNKRRQRVRNLGQRDLERLQALQGEALTMTLYHPGGNTQYRGLVEKVGSPKHSVERGSSSLYSMVTFRGREV